MEEKKELEKVICILNPDEIKQMHDYCSTNTSGLVTPYQINEIRDKEGYLIPRFAEHKIYSLHPYHREYIELNEQSEDIIVLDRINKIETILYFLGAKYCKILSTSVRTNNQSNDYSAKIGGENPGVIIDSGGSLSNSNRFGTATNVGSVSKWKGTYTIEDYQKAKEAARVYGLENDSTIQQLLIERDPSNKNVKEAKSYSIDVRSDLEEMKSASLDIKAKIKKANVGIDINGGYKSETKESRHNTFDFEVEFGTLEKPPITTLPDDIVTPDVPDDPSKKTNWTGFFLVALLVIIAVLLALVLL